MFKDFLLPLFLGGCACLFGWSIYSEGKHKSKMINENNQPIVMTVKEEIYREDNTVERKTSRSSGMGIGMPLSGSSSQGMSVIAGTGSSSYEVPVKDSQYILKGHAEGYGELAINIESYQGFTKESLDVLIEPGVRISFPRGNLFEGGGIFSTKYPHETYFRKGVQFGTKNASRIKILKNFD